MSHQLGRPSKFSTEKADAIIGAIRDGNTRENAAALAGIHVSTLYRWLGGEVGEEHGLEEAFRDFREQVEAAEAALESEMLGIIQAAARKHQTRTIRTSGTGDKKTVVQEIREESNVQAAQWLLARRNPGRWGTAADGPPAGGSSGVTIIIKADDRDGDAHDNAG